MPRIAKPRTRQASQAALELDAYLKRTRVTGNALARITGVRQSTISRFLSGRTKSVTEAIKPALAYAGIECKDGITASGGSSDSLDVLDALRRVAVDDPGVAELLARLIEAMAPVLRAYVPQTHRSVR